jgi:hypothetical protein
LQGRNSNSFQNRMSILRYSYLAKLLERNYLYGADEFIATYPKTQNHRSQHSRSFIVEEARITSNPNRNALTCFYIGFVCACLCKSIILISFKMRKKCVFKQSFDVVSEA